MKNKHLITLLQDNYTTVKAVFAGGEKEYTFKSDIDFEDDDLAVVHVNGIFKIVRIVSTDGIPDIDLDAEFEYKWIVQKIDRTEYHRKMELEKEAHHKLMMLEKASQRERLLMAFKEGFVDNESIDDELNKIVTLLDHKR